MVNEVVEEEIDLRDYLRVIWKNRMLILGIVLVSLITSVFSLIFIVMVFMTSLPRREFVVVIPFSP